MARNETYVAAPPEAVWDVLMEPESYAYWVVGSKKIRDVDPNWPEPGSRFHHTVGFAGPLTVSDNSEVEEIDEPKSLVLRVKARPLGVARVELYLKPEGNGTTVIMEENPLGGVVAKASSVVLDPAIKKRNVESLRRLKELAERRTGA